MHTNTCKYDLDNRDYVKLILSNFPRGRDWNNIIASKKNGYQNVKINLLLALVDKNVDRNLLG